MTAEGMGRRDFLRHSAWAGSAVVFSVAGGTLLSACAGSEHSATKDFTFAQISDPHIGFSGKANPDVTGSFMEAIAQVNALPERPAFVVNTGDLTHTSTPAQFDQVKQLQSTLKTDRVFVVPGEHDAVDDGGTKYLAAFGAGSQGNGWYSFDFNGVHFLALNNSFNLATLGHLGADQLAFIKKDLAPLKSDVPLVVLAHIPLFDMFPAWGWATDDAVQALSYMRRFGAVTVLNGHVHQVMSKVEGNITFHTATTTAYPLPAPGHAAAPAPLVVPSDKLHAALGIRQATYVAKRTGLALVDEVLA
jgi:3',5'-cyclic AMP phosphodiesterase CpdA